MKICRLIPLVACLALCACDQPAPHSQKDLYDIPQEVFAGRFKIDSQGRFKAGYDNNSREILIITDTQNQCQYLCITGVGVTELHTEQHGKQTVHLEE